MQKTKKYFIKMQFYLLYCLDACLQEYYLVLRQSKRLQCFTVFCCTGIIYLRQWELLVPAAMLLMIAVIDLRHYLIPDVLLCSMILSCVIADMLTGDSAELVVLFWLRRIENGLGIGIPLLIFVMLMDRLVQKETMGGGDIKLFFTIGFCLDVVSAYMVLYIACFIGLIWIITLQQKQEVDILPFGPVIAMSAGVVLIYNIALADKFFFIL